MPDGPSSLFKRCEEFKSKKDGKDQETIQSSLIVCYTCTKLAFHMNSMCGFSGVGGGVSRSVTFDFVYSSTYSTGRVDFKYQMTSRLGVK